MLISYCGPFIEGTVSRGVRWVLLTINYQRYFIYFVKDNLQFTYNSTAYIIVSILVLSSLYICTEIGTYSFRMRDDIEFTNFYGCS